MRVWRMRTGISITLKPADRRRLKALARDRNTPHKHVWRAEIVLLSADGIGTNEIMRRTGKSKTCVWRWQERFMEAGYDSLLHDKTRHSGLKMANLEQTCLGLSGTVEAVERLKLRRAASRMERFHAYGKHRAPFPSLPDLRQGNEANGSLTNLRRRNLRILVQRRWRPPQLADSMCRCQ